MAIAFDSATNGGSATATSLTYSHTVSGTNTFLYVTILGRVGATSLITGVTYAGVAMTYRDGSQVAPADRFLETWYLVGASTGANNIVISASGSDFIASNCVSYNGVSQGSLDATNTNFQATGTPNTNTVTTVTNSAWHIMGGANASGTPTAGTGSTIRSTANGNMAMFDGNGAITPVGSNSIGMTGMNSSFGSGTIGIAIAPATTYVIACSVGTFVLTGITTGLLFGRKLVSTVGAFTLTGFSSLFVKGYGFIASVGAFILTGINAGIRYGGWTKQTKNTTTWTPITKETTNWTNQTK